MKYFDHDTDAWKDEKVAELCFDNGLEAYGMYWVVLELIYAEGGAVNMAKGEPIAKAVARWFGMKPERVEYLVEVMCKVKLLKKLRGKKGSLNVTSERAEDNIARYAERCETARKNGAKGGRKPTKNQVGSDTDNQVGLDAETDLLTKGQANKRKEKVLVRDKPLPNTYGESAAAQGGATDIADDSTCQLPACRKCGSRVEASARLGKFSWVCPSCGVLDSADVVAGEFEVRDAG